MESKQQTVATAAAAELWVDMTAVLHSWVVSKPLSDKDYYSLESIYVLSADCLHQSFNKVN